MQGACEEGSKSTLWGIMTVSFLGRRVLGGRLDKFDDNEERAFRVIEVILSRSESTSGFEGAREALTVAKKRPSKVDSSSEARRYARAYKTLYNAGVEYLSYPADWVEDGKISKNELSEAVNFLLESWDRYCEEERKLKRPPFSGKWVAIAASAG